MVYYGIGLENICDYARLFVILNFPLTLLFIYFA